MRKLDKEHLQDLALIIVLILAVVFLPYLTFKLPFVKSAFIGTDFIEYAPTQWICGLLAIGGFLVTIVLVALILIGVYGLFNWLLPRVDNKDTKEKT